MSELEPGGLFGKAGTDAMLNGDVQLYEGGMRHKQTSIITGGQTESILLTQERNFNCTRI